jgi:ABC-2 type transport system ATP-binding protein
VVFSTHILSDVERICDRVAVLNNGRIVLCGELKELQARHGDSDTIINFATVEDRERFLVLPEIHTYYSLSAGAGTGAGAEAGAGASVTVSSASVESILMEAFV